MARKITVIIFIFLYTMFSALGAAAEDRASRDLKQIVDSGKVIVAIIDMDLPPFITRSGDGSLGGLDVDMARDIAQKLNVSLEIIRTDYFDDVVNLVAAREADIGLSNISITLDRAMRVKFTDTYRTLEVTMLFNRLKIASLKLPNGFENLEQIKGTQGPIGIVERSSYETAARRYFPRAIIRTFSGYEEMLAAAERGDVLMAAGNSGTIDSFLKREPHLLVKLRPYKIEGLKDHIAMAVGLESDHLLSWLNAYLTVKGVNQK